jgi:hypothetical protein
MLETELLKHIEILRKGWDANAISKSRTRGTGVLTYTMKVIRAVSIMQYYDSRPARGEYCKERKQEIKK